MSAVLPCSLKQYFTPFKWISLKALDQLLLCGLYCLCAHSARSESTFLLLICHKLLKAPQIKAPRLYSAVRISEPHYLCLHSRGMNDATQVKLPASWFRGVKTRNNYLLAGTFFFSSYMFQIRDEFWHVYLCIFMILHLSFSVAQWQWEQWWLCFLLLLKNMF